MKKIKLLLCFLVLVFSFSLSEGQSWMWAKSGYGEIKDLPYSVAAIDPQYGDVFVGGTYNSYIIFSPDTLNSTPIQDNAFIVKYNSAGQVLWGTCPSYADFLSGSRGTAIAANYLSQVYITGNYYGTMIFGPDTIVEGNNRGNMFLAKYDKNGNAIWAKNPVIAPNSYSAAGGTGVTVDHNTLDVLVTGYFSDTVAFGTTTLKTFDVPSQNIFIVKFDSACGVLWATQATLPSAKCQATPTSIIIDANHNIYATGYFNDTIIFGTQMLISNGRTSVYLVKYSPAGNLIWARQSENMATGAYATANSVIVYPANNPYICGTFNLTVGFGSRQLVATGFSAFITKYDTNGNALWAEKTNMQWEGFCLGSDGGSHIYFTGSSNGEDSVTIGGMSVKTTTRFLDGTAFLMEFDTSGTPICGSCINNLGALPQPVSVVAGNSNNVYVSGVFAADTLMLGPDTLLLQAVWNVAVARWQDCSVLEGINEPVAKNEKLEVYPNPFSSYSIISIHDSLTTIHYLELYDVTGQKLKQIEFSGNTYTLSAEGLAKGMYFIRVFDSALPQNGGGDVIGSSKIVVQ